MVTCKTCKQREYTRRYNEKSGYMGRRLSAMEELISRLKEAGCVYCGESDARCLDLHHLDPSEKKFSLNKGSWSRAEKELLKEAQLVQVPNCKMSRTTADHLPL